MWCVECNREEDEFCENARISMERQGLSGRGEGFRRRICPTRGTTPEEGEVFGVDVLDFYRRGLTLLCTESLSGYEGSSEEDATIRRRESNGSSY